MLKLNNKLLAIFLSVLLVSLFGCVERHRYIINCDSGFTTGDVYYALIDNGVIRWQDDHFKWISRKMINGEVCQVNILNKAN